MIRQICAKCGAVNTVDESAAGTRVPCTVCHEPLEIPAAYTPGVAAGGGVPPTPEPPKPLDPPAPPPPGLNVAALHPAEPGAPMRCHATLNPVWLDWIPAGAIALALVLTFFWWCGSYPGGVRVYSQNGWEALFGALSVNTLPRELVPEENDLKNAIAGNRWLILYFPLLLATLGLAWIERFVKNPTVTTVPGPLAWLPGVWPERFVLLMGLTFVLFATIVWQSWRGFGLEHAVRARVNAEYAAEEAQANDTPNRNIVQVRKGREFARYAVGDTTALDLLLAAHGLAFAAMAGRWWLHRRGAKPLPTVELHL